MTESKARTILRDFDMVLRRKGKLWESWSKSGDRRWAWGHTLQGLLDILCPIVHDDEFTRRVAA